MDRKGVRMGGREIVSEVVVKIQKKDQNGLK